MFRVLTQKPLQVNDIVGTLSYTRWIHPPDDSSIILKIRKNTYILASQDASVRMSAWQKRVDTPSTLKPHRRIYFKSLIIIIIII